MLPRLDLTIDRLVLDGLPQGGREAVVAAVERALARLIAQGGVLGQEGRSRGATQTSAEAIGEQVAQAVYAALVARQSTGAGLTGFRASTRPASQPGPTSPSDRTTPARPTSPQANGSGG